MFVILTLIVIFGSNIPEIIKKNQEYEQSLKEKNKPLTYQEQIQAIETLKELCLEVRSDPNSYMPEMVDKCR